MTENVLIIKSSDISTVYKKSTLVFFLPIFFLIFLSFIAFFKGIDIRIIFLGIIPLCILLFGVGFFRLKPVIQLEINQEKKLLIISWLRFRNERKTEIEFKNVNVVYNEKSPGKYNSNKWILTIYSNNKAKFNLFSDTDGFTKEQVDNAYFILSKVIKDA